MGSTTRDQLLRDLYNKLNSLVNNSGDSHSTAVCLRAENKHFRVYPDQCGSSFRTAVTALNPQVAIKGRTSAVRAVLANSNPEADDICLDGRNYIPVVESFVHLSNADKSQCATLVREEAVLVVWSDSDHDVVEMFRTLEHRLQHLSKLCHCSLVSCVSQVSDSSSDIARNPEGQLFSLGGMVDNFLSEFDWNEAPANHLSPLSELPELIYMGKTESLPGREAKGLLDNLSDDEFLVAGGSSLGRHGPYTRQVDYHIGMSPYADISPSETLYNLSSSSSSGYNLSTGSSSGMSLSPAVAHTPASGISPMLAISPMLMISPTITVAPPSPSPQRQPSKLRDWDDAAVLAAASIQDIADALQASSPVLEPSQFLTPANASAEHVTPSPAAQTAELPDEDEVGLDSGVFLPPPSWTHGRSKSTGGAAPVPSSSRLPTLTSRPMSVSRTSSASGSSTPDCLSPSLGSMSGRDGQGSLARFHATTSALGSYPYSSEGPSSRVVGQKSKRSQYDDDHEEEDYQDEADNEGDDEIDELGEDEYEDDGEDDDGDDDEYVEAFSSRPSGKRARSSSSSGPASASTSTAPPPLKKSRTRRRKTTTTGKRQRFSCPDCRETFGRRTDLKRHAGGAKCNGKGGNKKANKCEFCPKEFLRPDALKRHKRTVHRDIYRE